MRFFSFSLSSEQKKQGLILFGLVVVYLLSRLLWLEQIPIFSDEAEHMARAKMALSGDFCAGLEMGKYLTIQTYGVYLGFFPDTLFSVRCLVVMIGLVNLLLIFKLARDFGEQRSFQRGIFAALTYVVLPFAFFYDRLFVADQFQTFFCICVLTATLRIFRQGIAFSSFNVLLLLLSLLFAPLFKTSGVLFAMIPLALVFLITGPVPLRDRLWKLVPVYLAYFPLLAAFLCWVGPRGDTGRFFSMSLAQIPRRCEANAGDMLGAHWDILSPPFFLILVGGVLSIVFFAKNAGVKERVYACVGLIAVLLVPYILGARFWSLRYFLPELVPICLLTGILMDELILFLFRRCAMLQPYVTRIAVLGAMLGPPCLYSIMLVIWPEGYKCDGDFYQYFTERTSGYGVRDAARFLRRVASESPSDFVFVLSPRSEAGMNLGLEVYYRELGDKVHRRYLIEKAVAVSQVWSFLQSGHPIYLVHDGMRGEGHTIKMVKENFKLTLRWHSTKPGGGLGYKIFQVENK